MMRTMLYALISLSVFGGAALYLCPQGGVKRIMRLLLTAILAAAVLTPLRAPDYDFLSLEEAKLNSLEIKILEESRRKQNRLQGELLRQNCERYVMTRAEALGLRVRAVEITLDRESALPYAVKLEVSGGGEEMEILCQLIRDELGIPIERQAWITDG